MPACTIRAPRSAASSFHSLSFVRRGRKVSNWYLPLPLGADPGVGAHDRDLAIYGIGCRQGEAAAREYLAMTRSSSHPSTVGGRLPSIVLGMLDAERGDHLRGQLVGFFFTLESALVSETSA